MWRGHAGQRFGHMWALSSLQSFCFTPPPPPACPHMLPLCFFQPAVKRHQAFSPLLTPLVAPVCPLEPLFTSVALGGHCRPSWWTPLQKNHPFRLYSVLSQVLPAHSFLHYSCEYGTKSYCFWLLCLPDPWMKQVFKFSLQVHIPYHLDTTLTGIYSGLGNKLKSQVSCHNVPFSPASTLCGTPCSIDDHTQAHGLRHVYTEDF